MLYTTPDTQSQMLLHIDKYSDSFTEDATVESLHEAFEQVDRLKENYLEMVSVMRGDSSISIITPSSEAMSIAQVSEANDNMESILDIKFQHFLIIFVFE